MAQCLRAAGYDEACKACLEEDDSCEAKTQAAHDAMRKCKEEAF